MKQFLFILLISFFVVCQEAFSQSGFTTDVERVSDGVQDQVEDESASLRVSVVDNCAYIENAPENSVLEVKNMLGENVLVVRLTGSEQRIQLNLKKGFYIVRIDNHLQRIIVK